MVPLELYSFLFGAISVLLFGVIASVVAHRRYYAENSESLTNVDFVTARNSLGVLTIAWSIYSNAIGAGTAFFPPSYATTPGVGLVGLFSNAIANVIPPLFIAFFGTKIRQDYPDALSLSHFMYLRYGRAVQVIVGILVMFNMAIALTVEYTAISSIYRDLVGSKYSLVILFIIGAVTAGYTAYGGLYASLVTDRFQGFAGIMLLSIISLYLAVGAELSFDKPFPQDLLVPDSVGWSSVFVLPVSILTGTLLSEASFQRAWAAYDDKTLKLGAMIGSFFIFIVVSLFALGGILAVWMGRTVSNPNNILFALIGPPYAPTALTVIVVVVVTIMNTSAVDSIQNGLVSVVTSNLLANQNVWYSRFLTVFLNAICLLVGYLGLNSIVTLFAITNIITTMASVFFAGLFDTKRQYVTRGGVLFGFGFAMVNIVIYGWAVKRDVIKGLRFVFLEDVYNYPTFLVALTSWVGLALYQITYLAIARRRKLQSQLPDEQ